MRVTISRNGLRAARMALPDGVKDTLRSSFPDGWLRQKVDNFRLDQALRERGGLTWKRSRSCPQRLFDAGGARIGDMLFVVCGYTSQDGASNRIHGFDMARERWVKSIRTPDTLANSHCAVTSDGERFLYFASGQVGAQCRPAVRQVFCYDTVDGCWHDLPDVPAARYAATMQLWRGRLHLIGGAAEDRWTPTDDHWSLGMSGAVAEADGWRAEVPVPVAGMHRGSAIVGDSLFIFGGQQGDFMPVPGDPECKCTGKTQETYLSSAFRLDDPSGTWKPIADLPVPTSHTDFSTVVKDDKILLLGGQIFKHPEKFYLRLTDAIQCYDTTRDRWSIVGHLPYHLKIPVVALRGNTLFVTTGQRGKGRGDVPGAVVSDTWKTMLPDLDFDETGRPTRQDLDGKNILMISHDLSRTGAPLLLVETAQALLEQGAAVRVATLSDDAKGWNLASEFGLPLVPRETAISHGRDADVIVVNTTSAQSKEWVKTCLETAPELAKKISWWIHEIDVDHHREDAELLQSVNQVIFDSEAARAAWAEDVCLPDKTAVVHPGLSEAFVSTSTEPRYPLARSSQSFRSRKAPKLTREEIRRRLGVAPDEFLLCSIGTFVPRKGQRLLIRTVAAAAAAQQLPVKLLIVGFKNERQRRMVLTGLSDDERQVLSPSRAFLSQADLGAFYAASDAYVMNSQGDIRERGECFGRTSIEAMAFGLPVLGTDAGGTAEIILEGITGLKFPVGGAGQPILAEQIARLIQDPDLAGELGQAGRARAIGYFSQDRYMGEIADALSVSLESPDRGGADVDHNPFAAERRERKFGTG